MSKVRKKFNEIIKEKDLDMLMDTTRKVCSHKIKRKGIKFPAYLDREDIIQEASLRVLKAYKTFDSRKANANTFFNTVIDNLLKDYLKKSSNESRGKETFFQLKKSGNRGCKLRFIFYGGLDYKSLFGVADIDYRYKLRELLIDLSTILTEREKKVLFLRSKGYTHHEIAKRIGFSRPTVANDWAKIKEIILNLV